MDNVLQDIRYALRLCVRTPGFTMIAVLALALGIGANTAIFTIVNAVLLEPLPFRDPGRLAVLWETNARRPGRPNTIAPANFIRWQERATVFERMAPFYDYRVNLTGGGEPEELIAQDVTPDFFPTLGVTPLLGRTFAPDDSRAGALGLDIDIKLGTMHRHFGWSAIPLASLLPASTKPVSTLL